MNITTLNALIEALQGGVSINKVLIGDYKKDKKTQQIIALCRERKIIFQVVPRQAIDRKAGPNHQGVFAEAAPIRFYTLEELLDQQESGLLLLLDGVNDAGNMGAIIRSAAAAGVDGLVLSQRNSAPINETVLKTSAGNLLKVKIAYSKNLGRDLDLLKKKNFWVVGTDAGAETSYFDFDLTYPTAILLGGEHRGVSPLLKKKADQLVSIPHAPGVESLNVSAAAAVVLFEALRQRQKGGKTNEPGKPS